ncbi:hypothetical protein EVAR_47562_1 [Eumeta japonica]|uniref:Uncharacterized protein n=1 Tax=Eumeta variegata TaxID=151549 RepID=A0A4C1WS04_EUMVA|nr:hypothetical protein EVAR_47562_1 [Eumeta japonica]
MLSGIKVLQVGPVYYADLVGTQANSDGRVVTRDTELKYRNNLRSMKSRGTRFNRCLAALLRFGPYDLDVGPWEWDCPYLLSSETTAKGTGLGESAGKEDPVELDSSLAL